MIKSEKGIVTIEGRGDEVLADLSVIMESLREDGVLSKGMYELMWKMSEPKESTTIDIEELRRQANDTV